MNNPLDQSSLDTATDAQLNELFAVEVAGWTMQTVYCGVDGTSAQRLIPPSGDLHSNVRDTEFTTDANAVLPWLEKEYHWEVFAGTGGKWTYCGISGRTAYNEQHERDDPCEFEGRAPTFPRAAVIALIRAKRAGKGS